MKKLSAIVISQIIAFLFVTSSVHAWYYSTFDNESRETIVRNAGEMIGFSWSPLNTVDNWTCTYDSNGSEVGYTFTNDTIWRGEAYTQCDTRNWADFYSTVNGTSGGDTRYGNDCSGYVSASWKLPKRYNTTAFECDAKDEPTACNQYNPATDNYVTKLGEVGGGENVQLQRGDAFNKSGSHIVLFKNYRYNAYGNKAGIDAMEQTPPKARDTSELNYTDWNSSAWPWSKLTSYRPIRRNNILEHYFNTTWGYSGSGNDQLSWPSGVTVDPYGSIYVADTDNHRVQKFTSDGTYVSTIGTFGFENGQFVWPADVASDSTGNIYVVEAMSCKIQKFTGSGAYVWNVNFSNNGTENCTFEPTSVAVDSSGNIYIMQYSSTYTDAIIKKYDSNGNWLAQWGSFGSGNGQLSNPTGIAVDASGYVYVADAGNYRIQKFTTSGTYVAQWGSNGSGNGYFYYPGGIAIDAYGYVYVADSGNNLIQKFTSDGVYVSQWGTYGTGYGALDNPQGIAIDSSGNAYVADSGNNRIQKFSGLPKGPTNLTATPSSNGHVTLSWQDNSDNETMFYIKRKTGVRGTYSNIGFTNANVTTYEDTDTVPGETYYYAVWAYNSNGDSAYSDEVDITYYTLNVYKTGTGEGIVTNVTAGTDCNSDCTGYYKAGTQLTLMAMASSNSSFTGWYGACGGTEMCQVTMDGNKGVMADFDGVPVASINPSSYDFGSTSGQPTAFTVSNQGLDALIISQVYLSGTNSSEFIINADNCYGQSIQPGANCTVQVKFSPTSAGTKSAAISVQSNDPVNALLEVPLYGTGQTLPTSTITASAGFGGSISPSGAVTVNNGTNQAFTVTPDPGYYVVDVRVDGASQGAVSGYAFTNVTANHTIEANFGITVYTISTNTGSGGGTISPSSPTVNYGGSQTFTITPDTGYHIVDVKVDGVPKGAVSSYTIYNATSAHTVEASFSNTHTITATAGSGGSISPSGAMTVLQGENQTFTITPNTGFHIMDVKVDGVSQGGWSSYSFSNISANHIIEAIFAINTYIVTPSAGANGSISPAIPQTVNDNGTMSFTVTPNIGYHILSVTGCGGALSGNIYTTGAITADCSVMATFATNTYNLTVSKSGMGSINVISSPFGISCGTKCTASFSPGTIVTLTAVPGPATTFTGWSGGGCSGMGDCTVTLYSDTTAIAEFTAPPSAVSVVSAGDAHTVAIRADGTLWAWGANYSGEIGDGTTTNRQSPVQIGSDTNWSKVVARYSHTFAVKTDRTLWGWGYNYSGQLGDGTTIYKLSPIQINTDADWAEVAAGNHHTVAVKENGTLWAWGDNYYGQIGDGTSTDKLSPVQIGTDTDWVSVSPGGNHTAAIKADGTLWAWGDNGYGQLGDGTTTNKLSPTQISTDTDWLAVSAGDWHTLALKSDGTLWSWGWNGQGRLGDGTTTNKLSPIKIGGDTDWAAVSAGGNHTMALKANGSFWAWGYNYYGQLGDGTTINKLSPVQIGADTDWVKISAGDSHTAALKTNGTLWTWGHNNDGRLGDGTTTNRYSPIWTFGREEIRPVSAITATAGSGGSISPSGTVTVNYRGSQVFTITPSAGYHVADVVVDGVSKGAIASYTFAYDALNHSIEASFEAHLIIKKSGLGSVISSPSGISCGPKCIGAFAPGTEVILTAIPDAGTSFLGWSGGGCSGTGTCTVTLNGDTTVTASFTVLPSAVLSVTAGEEYTVVVRADGSLWAWGYNGSGRLGDGTTTRKLYPVQIGIDTNWVAVSAGSRHTTALRADRTLWAWGNNYHGQLGDGTTIDKVSPVQVGSDADWVAVSAGWLHTLALKSNGTLWAWGYNSSGQLGDGTTSDKLHPVQIGTDTNWIAVSAAGHSAALKTDGTLWTWGDNYYGQLGDGTTIDKLSPVQVGIDADWVAVSSGDWHILALKSNGSLWAWGYNGSGQLGDGTTTGRLSPVRIGSDMGWAAISAGTQHVAALKADGTLWAWGANWDGRLGDGTTTGRLYPVQIGTDADWAGISAGYNHTAAIKANGTLWTWGNNGFGQLGNGTTVPKYSPVWTSGRDELRPVTITATTGNGGTITPASATVNYGSNLTYAITPDTGHHILDVKVDGISKGAITSYTFDYVTVNHAIEVSFAINTYNIIIKKSGTGLGTVTSSPVGISCGTDCKASFEYGNVILTATPNEGYIFTGWSSGGCSGTGTCTVTLNSDTTVTATFAASYSAVIATAVGDYHTVALKADGTLWSWGANWYGQLGDGTTWFRSSSVRVGQDNDWVAITAGSYHTAALKTDGSLWTWGDNWQGQIGDGTTIDRSSPVQIGTGPDWIVISAGAYHTVALKADGTLWGWGYNYYGQLGDGTTTNRLSPVQIGTGTDWIAISAGLYHTVALKADGTLWAWGYNSSGQLGDGTTTYKSSPVKIGTGTDWAAISAGGAHTLALKNNGSLWAWGDNDYGQIGDGSLIRKSSPAQIGTDTNWAIISAGNYYTTAVKTDSTLWAWGYNEYGQLGDGSSINQVSPIQIGTDTDWSVVTGGWNHTAAIKTNGTLWTWGKNSHYQLGDGTFTDRFSPIWVFGRDEIRPMYTITAISGSGGTISPSSATVSLGGNQTFFITPDTGYHVVDVTVDGVSKGAVYAYAFTYVNADHVIEASFAINTYALTVSKVGGGAGTVTSSSTGIDCGSNCSEILEWGTTITLTATSSAGSTFVGWYGGGCSGTDSCTITIDSDAIVTAAFSSSYVPTSVMSAGSIHTAAIKTDGTLWSWGGNWYGALGDGTTTDRYSPIQIGADTDWLKISSGGFHTVAIKNNGTLWTWGNNSSGQLGDGTTEDKWSPVQIGTDTNWIAVSAGYTHTVAIKDNGTLWAWGSNWSGQLGDGTGEDKLTPAQIGTDTGWTAVYARDYHTVALKTDGTLWAWGDNSYGQLGDWTPVKLFPAQIGTDTDWAKIAAGAWDTMALKSDGTLWGWGLMNWSSSPVQIGSETWSNIAAGYTYTAIVKTDGTLWQWGSSMFGSGILGDWTTNDIVQIGTDTNWTAVTIGEDHAIALKTDGTLWAWGSNWYGQVGDGTPTDRYSPVPLQ